MPGAGRYIVRMQNTAAGASNPALVTFHVSGAIGVTQGVVAAQLISLSQYMLCAAGTTTEGIDFSVAPTGATLPLAFPVAEYAINVGGDAVLVPGAAWPIPHGQGALATLGAGAVVSRRTTTPGRSGRGRFTSPWFGLNHLSGTGGLLPISAASILNGCDMYLDGNPGTAPLSGALNLNEYVESATGSHLVVARTVSSRLGRLRSRTR